MPFSSATRRNSAAVASRNSRASSSFLQGVQARCSATPISPDDTFLPPFLIEAASGDFTPNFSPAHHSKKAVGRVLGRLGAGLEHPSSRRLPTTATSTIPEFKCLRFISAHYLAEPVIL